jgi:hypothetical protein
MIDPLVNRISNPTMIAVMHFSAAILKPLIQVEIEL